MQSYYEYVRARKSQGKLSEEQFEACKEGNIGGILGYSTKVEELAKKYNIPEKDMDHILGKYSSIEKFYEQYKNGAIKDFDDIDFANLMFKKVIDIDGKNNPYLEKKFAELFGPTFNSNGIQINFYSSEGLKKAITTLTPREQEIIERRFDLNEGGGPRDLESIGEDFSTNRTRIYNIEQRAVRKLRHPSRTKIFIVDINELKNSEFLTDEEKKQLTEIEDDIIINSNTDTGSKYLETFQSIFQAFQDRKTLSEEPIEQLDFSVRTHECLKRVGVKTINDLTNMTEEELRSVRNIGSGVDEILAKIAEYNLSLSTEQDERRPKGASAITIEEMNLSVRAFNSLARAGISTLGDLIKLTEEDLKKIKNLGPRGVEEVLRKIKEYEIENNTDEVQEQTGEDIMQEQRKPQTELENEAEHIESIIQDSNEQDSNEQETNEQEPNGQMASNQESSEQYRDMTTEQLQELIAKNTEKIAKNEATIKSRLIARLLEQQKIISGQEKVINALEEERAQKKEI